MTYMQPQKQRRQLILVGFLPGKHAEVVKRYASLPKALPLLFMMVRPSVNLIDFPAITKKRGTVGIPEGCKSEVLPQSGSGPNNNNPSSFQNVHLR
jgi:hypothetical protein